MASRPLKTKLFAPQTQLSYLTYNTLEIIAFFILVQDLPRWAREINDSHVIQHTKLQL